MSVKLYLVPPAAAVHATCLVQRVREAAGGLLCEPRVVVPNPLQARAWRRRLAQCGGALGVRVLTFDRLCAELLTSAGDAYIELSDPVQYRLMRAVVDELPIRYYAPLAARPGFIHALQELIAELKAACVEPERFRQAVAAIGDGGSPLSLQGGGRLLEIAQIYARYQQRLLQWGWVDRAGMGWLAIKVLAEASPPTLPGTAPEVSLNIARDWQLLVVDGFDSFTEVQLGVLALLVRRLRRAGDVVITLIGGDDCVERPLVHRRANRTRQRLERALKSQHLSVEALPDCELPDRECRRAPAAPLHRLAKTGDYRRQGTTAALVHLEANLFGVVPGCVGGRVGAHAERLAGQGSVQLVEASDRMGEARAALRWLKACLVHDGMRLGEVALLARSVTPYRPFILQAAAEFGLPIQIVDGLPLRFNPAVAALLDLLRLMLPGSGDLEPALPRRLVIEAWRCPYFDWTAWVAEDAGEPIGIAPQDAELLDNAARWRRVLGGLTQWQETLDYLAGRPEASADGDEELPAGIPNGAAAQQLRGKFARFVQRLRRLQEGSSYRDFVERLESLIGEDPDLRERETAPLHPLAPPCAPLRRQGTTAGRAEPAALHVVDMIRKSEGEIAERDIVALRSFKEVLRGLVWAEDVLTSGKSIDFPHFVDELTGAVDAASCLMPVRSDQECILIADVVHARGLPFRAVAVLGLAEGEFPATLREDPFLRDADRALLSSQFGLPLASSTESAEMEYFYEMIAQPRERLLLTRPRLADNGAPWEASPFWEEVRRLVEVTPQNMSTDSVPALNRVASWPELLQRMALRPDDQALHEWARGEEPEQCAAVDAAAHLLGVRAAGSASHYDGDLTSLEAEFAHRFGASHVWSASRLEAYCTCPYSFFIGRVLGVEPRAEPFEGLDARQRGNIYHAVFKRLYASLAPSERTHLGQLLKALPAVAEHILDAAPQREGFRATAWWSQTRTEIQEDVRRSVEALAQLGGDFVPTHFEVHFGAHTPLVVSDGADQFRMHGIIDRIDCASDGGLRIIDYKSGGSSSYSPLALFKGRKLQLPLYALAAQAALGLGEPRDGFYWHLGDAKMSGLRLSRFAVVPPLAPPCEDRGLPKTGDYRCLCKGDDGPQGAIRVALQHAWVAVRGARGGQFTPQPPDDGCPATCAAADFCWHYRPRRWS